MECGYKARTVAGKRGFPLLQKSIILRRDKLAVHKNYFKLDSCLQK